MAFICHSCWGCNARDLVCLFPAILPGIHPSATASHEGAFILKPFFNDLQQSRTLLPNKHATLFMFLRMSARNILVVIPDPQLNSKCHKYMQLHNSSNSTTSTIQVIWEQSYKEIHGAAIIHKTLKWPMYLSLWMISDFYHSVATVFTLVDGTRLMMAGIYQFQDSVSVREVSKQLPS